MSDKPLPHDPEAEASIISGCLGSEDLMNDYASLVPVAHFYCEQYRKIYQTLLDLHTNTKPTDLAALVSELRSRGQLEACGGPAAVAAIYDYPPAVNPPFYAEKLREHFLRRRMFEIGVAFQKAAFQTNGPAAADLARINGLVLGIDADMSDDSCAKIDKLVIEAGDRYEALNRNPGTVTGIQTGYANLDRQTCGLQRCDLWILAARPSMGKTALATCIAIKSAEAGFPVGIFSLEMSRHQLADRMTAILSGVNLMKFRSGRFDSDNWAAITSAHEKLHDLPIIIDDTGGLHINEIRRRARRMKTRENVALIVVDYIGLAVGEKANGRVEEVSSISRGLKALAKELDVVVLALSQLNRSCEMRDERRPRLSDLRDSGAIEQDADVVAFIYRDEVYHTSPDNPNRGTAEIILAKQRNGPVGTITLRFCDRNTRFLNLETGYGRSTPSSNG
jgi:replicative DNA helicase